MSTLRAREQDKPKPEKTGEDAESKDAGTCRLEVQTSCHQGILDVDGDGDVDVEVGVDMSRRSCIVGRSQAVDEASTAGFVGRHGS